MLSWLTNVELQLKCNLKKCTNWAIQMTMITSKHHIHCTTVSLLCATLSVNLL